MVLSRIFKPIYSIQLAVITFHLLWGCQSEKKPLDSFTGAWNAHWTVEDTDELSDLDSSLLRMNGQLVFSPDGKVEISAFGFDGCIFSEDTAKEVLDWKLDDLKLTLIDEGDDHGISYVITSLTNNEIDLVLLNDIHLKLSRN